MLDQFKKIVFAFLLVGSSFSLYAQDAKVEKKEEKHIKIEVIDKDGKKHVIDEKFTGEMPEALKKKIADLKAKMKAEGKDLKFDLNFDGDKNSKFIIREEVKGGDIVFEEGSPTGKVKVVMIDEEGGKNVWVEKFEGEEMPESLKQKVEKLQSEAEKDGKKMTIDISIDGEAGDGLHDLKDVKMVKDGHVVIIKDGKTELKRDLEEKCRMN